MKGRPDLAAFRGDWHLIRRIRDRRAGQIIRFRGHAQFDPETGGLSYREAGLMTLAGQSFPAERHYGWRDAGADIAVQFSDGRPFHMIGPAETSGADHDCSPDYYRVRYDFRRWPLWRACWAVSGPAKSYQMLSVYTPPDAGP